MNNKTITLPEENIDIYDECDILVVGGGAAGHSAAIAAARAGAKNIVIIERYGYMGGDATGGYVIMVPNLSWYDKSFVRGIQEEWFTRLSKIPGAVKAPSLDDIGSTDPTLIYAWSAFHDCVSRGGFGGSKPSCLVRAVYFEPNQLKIEMDKMLLEHKDVIRVQYHSWGTKPIMEGNEIQGVVFESKEGRKAILAKTVIDATGDGDIFAQAEAPHSTLFDQETRAGTTALVWRIGGIDWAQFHEWKQSHPEQMLALRDTLHRVAGFRSLALPSNQNDICWINNWHSDRNCTLIKDQTETEMNTRNTMRDVIEYLREVVPVAFKNAYLYDIAPQLGTRCSRRLIGEYVMSTKDFAYANQFEDVIAWHSTICQINDCAPVEIPYRSILPQKIENLLCPGRHMSADAVAIDWLNLIPQCIGTGQAAGVAAAVAIQDGVSVRNIDIRKVQDILVDQDVPLPRNEKFEKKDPSYRRCVEEHNYGLYTDAAIKAKEEADYIEKFRQDQVKKTNKNL
ncbi:FAD-dependent oxidoreductase [Alkalibaculum sp. M08DMB]|uniref:FAD-dependent oxidoreductase n=1 Tax=Alkalibaculum sporogenes TaxID=2655001 RepID=A0A6A7KCT8_9FIRM|nr:FAD-dependent oxidoreductase [Alkalibaculum sporogenes]MPW27349.1 FAD-dependent oxidoreductase [Alkalibaculum sporogenes]